MLTISEQMQEMLNDRLKTGNKKVTLRVEVDKLVYSPNITTELDYVAFMVDSKTPEIIGNNAANITSAAYVNSPIKDVTVADLKVTSPFGMRLHPIQNTNIMHEGVDLGYTQGTKVVASSDGVVTQVTSNEPRYVTILHANKTCTRYMHVYNIAVREGQQVTQGQIIADVGPKDSYSSGPHLHFEVRTGASKDNYGEATDPMPYLKKSSTLANISSTVESTPATGSTTGKTIVRLGASTDSSVVGELVDGTQVTVFGKVGEWYSISSDTITGYAHVNSIVVTSIPSSRSGGNPSYREIYNYIKSYSEQLGMPSQLGWSTAWKESDWTQFNSVGTVLIGGEDYGLMQLNKPSHPSAFPTCETDWQFNVRYGLDVLYTHYKHAQTLYSDEVSRARSSYSAYNTGSDYDRWATETDERDTGFYTIYCSSPWNAYTANEGMGGSVLYGIVTSDVVSIRSTAEITVDNVLVTANKGMTIENLGATSGWYKVKLPDGRIGYIPEGFFKPIHEATSSDFAVTKSFSDDFEKYTVYSVPSGYTQDGSKSWKVEFDGVSNCLSISSGGNEANTVEFVADVLHSGRFDVYYKVDLVENNAFHIFVDGSLVFTRTGVADATYNILSIPLLSGSHVIKLAREKTVDGNDSIKIDNLAVYSYTYIEDPYDSGSDLAVSNSSADILDSLVVKSDAAPVYASPDASSTAILYANRGTEYPIKEVSTTGWVTILLPDQSLAYIVKDDNITINEGGYVYNQLSVHAGGFVFDKTLTLDNVISVSIDSKYDMRSTSAQIVIENFMGYYSPDARFNKFPENGIHKSPFVDYEDGNPMGVLSENTPIRIYIGYGDNPPRKFTGLIDAVDISGDGQSLTIRCSDMMKKLNNYYNYKELSYPPDGDPKTAWVVSSVLHDMASKAGLSGWRVTNDDLNYPDIVVEETWYTEVKPDSGYVVLKDENGISYEVSIDSIPVDGGYSNPFKWGNRTLKAGTCFGDEIDDICQEIGYWQRCDNFGTYRCTPVLINPLPTAYFKDTKSIISLDKSIDYSKTKNHVIITGAGGSEHFFDLDLWKAIKGERRSSSVSVPWADTYGKKKVVAEKMFEDMKRQARTLQCAVEGNPYIELLDTIGVDHAKSSTSDTYIVKGLRDSWSSSSGYITYVDLYWMGV